MIRATATVNYVNRELMKFLDRVVQTRAQEQVDSIDNSALRYKSDTGPLEVDAKRYKIADLTAEECRWCGNVKRRRNGRGDCRHCGYKNEPCHDCSGPVGRMMKGPFCHSCNRMISISTLRKAKKNGTNTNRL